MTHPDESSRPAAVSNALGLFYIALGMGAVQVLVDGSLLSDGAGLMFFAFSFVVLLLLVTQVARGRNWARIALLVLFLIGLPFSLPTLTDSLATKPFSGILAILQTVFQATGLWMVFSAGARRWFDPAERAEAIRSGEMKQCPYCAEWIRRAAIKCRYCGSDLAPR